MTSSLQLSCPNEPDVHWMYIPIIKLRDSIPIPGTHVAPMGLAAGCFLLAATAAVGVDPPKSPTDQGCRLIVNWDQQSMYALQLTYAHRDRDPNADDVKAQLEAIVDEHAKARIDRIVHCVFAMPRGTVPRDFKSFYEDPLSDVMFENRPIGLKQLEEAGYDLIQIFIDQSHKNGVEFLGGFRMNDRHAKTNAFQNAHPEWQLKELPGGLDYKYEGVRNAVLDVIEEFLARYDVDGLELDWMRWCHMFRPSEAEQNSPLLNDFIAKVRQRLDQAAKNRNRGRLVLGVRHPQSLEECRTLGFDVRSWVKSGHVDFICPSDFFHTDFNIKIEEFVELTRGTACRVYPSIHPRISHGNAHHVQSPENYRAAAHNYYAFGAHGISVYNYQYHWRNDMGSEHEWPRAMSVLTPLRNPEAVAHGTRHYLYHPLWSGKPMWLSQTTIGAAKMEHIELDRKASDPSGSLEFRLAEDLTDTKRSALLSFKATGLRDNDELEVRLNGKVVPTDRTWDADGQTATEGRVLPAFHVYRTQLVASSTKFGDNTISVRLSKNSGDTASNPDIQEMEVLVSE